MSATTPTHHYATTAGVIANNQLLPLALNATLSPLHQANPQNITAVIAWGRKPSYHKAKAYANKHKLPLISVEDGFLRSLDSGTQSRYGASFVVDDLGIYFDLTAPNRLQALIFKTVGTWHDDKQRLSRASIRTLLDERLSKYNATLTAPNLPSGAVLVIDQVAGDASITGSGVNELAFYEMLKVAITQNPTRPIVIKAHPAGLGVLTPLGKLSQDASAYLDAHLPLDKVANYRGQIHIVSDVANPIALLAQVEQVYTVSSHMGFEALLLNKKVSCFGVNWYAGFGLTDDTALQGIPLYLKVQSHHQALADKYHAKASPSLEQLFYASYVAYSRYVNPATLSPCTLDDVMTYLVTNREYAHLFKQGILAYGFSKWKVGFVQAFLGLPKVSLDIRTRPLWTLVVKGELCDRINQQYDKLHLPTALATGVDYVVWGQNAKQDLLRRLVHFQSADSPTPTVFCMEDGFIRSNGLGASLLEPLSVVVDELGIYYDATQPSRLEHILSQIRLTDSQNQRADDLRQRLLTQRVSKYNVGTKSDLSDKLTALQKAKPNANIRLVVGQVEDDASVRLCGSTIKRNGDLLRVVRQGFPDDIIIYKPHPDVEAGLRTGKVSPDVLLLADLVAHDTPMPDCLAVCQVVHTISSLTGFEALIRGRGVVCYGLPFYAGFGLTDDAVEAGNTTKQSALDRRKRATPLTLNELIYATLISYPLYRLPQGYGLATPEAVIDYLYGKKGASPMAKLSPTAKLKRKIKTTAMRVRQIALKK